MNKVKSIVNENYAYNESHKFTVTFDDGWSGAVWFKSTTPPFSEGDVIDGDRGVDGRGNNRFSYKKPRQGGGGPSKNPTGQMVGMAVNNAIQLVIHGKVEIKDIEKIADRICQISKNLEDKYKA